MVFSMKVKMDGDELQLEGDSVLVKHSTYVLKRLSANILRTYSREEIQKFVAQYLNGDCAWEFEIRGGGSYDIETPFGSLIDFSVVHDGTPEDIRAKSGMVFAAGFAQFAAEEGVPGFEEAGIEEL